MALGTSYAQDCLRSVGLALASLAAHILKIGYDLTGPVANWFFSTRLQRAMFILLARYNAPVVVLCAASAVAVAFYLHPTSGFVIVLVGLLPIAIWSMYTRLRRGASMLISSVYGRELRVHLPATHLEISDRASFRDQAKLVLSIARSCRAKSVTFNSPLLVSASTSELLARAITRAAAILHTEIAVEVESEKELSAVDQSMFAGHQRRYKKLRDGRLAVGPNGRFLSRKIMVQMGRV
ncbi:hypothetical protein SBC1_80490 (plasmid) [Caballeronia sp. SBC1]|uniref:hypothetical protein n=1 Tax=unclassified Caballeronia TaxID=2646786 RepID=UPI00140CA356|nr:hypothetical protein [Caballeronia sp. SBC1]QIN68002.1 hypothetical protein SBC1_80490 [Caballeronia sp. SBC1]